MSASKKTPREQAIELLDSQIEAMEAEREQLRVAAVEATEEYEGSGGKGNMLLQAINKLKDQRDRIGE